MKNIKMIYQYDGSSFYGFQRQPEKRTVQGEIEKALKIVLREEITMVSSGRTDRGVHAIMQVSNFFTASKIPLENLERVLKNLFPDDIKLLGIEVAPEEFHARFSAVDRAYEYTMTWEKSPFERRYVSFVEGEVDPGRFQEILTPILGRHNFEGFMLNDSSDKNPEREIFEIRCYKKEENKVAVYIRGNAFLKSQIRIIMGTALAVYFGRRGKDYLVNKLESPEKYSEKIVAEGSGLYLCHIGY